MNKDGHIQIDEFVRWVCEHMGEAQEKEPDQNDNEQALCSFSAKAEGALYAEELKAAIAGVQSLISRTLGQKDEKPELVLVKLETALKSVN